MFDRVYYINLDYRTDRRAGMEEQLHSMGMYAERVGAIAPPTANGHETVGAYGCKLSHLKVLQQAKADKAKHILILEDDAIFAPDFMSKCKLVFDELMLQPVWQMCYLFSWRCKADLVSPHLIKINGTQCTHAYAVHERAFDFLIDLAREESDKRDIDQIYNENCKHLNVFSSVDQLVFQPQHKGLPAKSDIRNEVEWKPKVAADVPTQQIVSKFFPDEKRYLYPLDGSSVVFDVGVYKGDFSAEIYRRYGSKIFGFEPAPEFFDRCAARLGTTARLFNYGIMATPGERELVIDTDATSVFIAKHNKPVVKAQFRTLAWAMDDAGVDQIDLLKLNIESAEFEVLEQLIESKLIHRINFLQVQFHYGPEFTEARDKTLFPALLESHNCEWRWDIRWQSYRRKKHEV